MTNHQDKQDINFARIPDIVARIRELAPNFKPRNATRAELLDILRAEQKRQARIMRTSALCDMFPLDSLVRLEDATEADQHGYSALTKMGWAIANSLSTMSNLINDLAGLRDLAAQYRLLKSRVGKPLALTAEQQALLTPAGLDLVVIEADAEAILERILMRLEGFETTPAPTVSQRDLRLEVERQENQARKLQERRAQYDAKRRES